VTPANVQSLELISATVRAEREAHSRHADALDTKAGVVLGFSGAVAAVASGQGTSGTIPGIVAAVAASLLALLVILPRSFLAWDLGDLRRYLGADPSLTALRMLDTDIVMVQRVKHSTERRSALLRVAVLSLAAAVALIAGSTLLY
jgi:hypothetical protein